MRLRAAERRIWRWILRDLDLAGPRWFLERYLAAASTLARSRRRGWWGKTVLGQAVGAWLSLLWVPVGPLLLIWPACRDGTVSAVGLWLVVILLAGALVLKLASTSSTRDPRVEAAVRAFMAKYPERGEPDGRPVQLGRDGSAIVTIVYFGGHIPLSRSWWRVTDHGAEELDYPEAVKVVDIPAWR